VVEIPDDRVVHVDRSEEAFRGLEYQAVNARDIALVISLVLESIALHDARLVHIQTLLDHIELHQLLQPIFPILQVS